MITRNNYEEFFLLYVDDELSATDRKAVEQFVDGNPDLREEWELTLQCKIEPDQMEKIVFSPIDAANHEEYFLNYVDGELDVTTRALVEDYARRHASLQPEFRALQQSVLSPDPSVVFPDKSRLYRREGTRRIPGIPWKGMAAAAVTIGIVVLLIFKSGKNGSADPGISTAGSKLPAQTGAAAREGQAATAGTPRQQTAADPASRPQTGDSIPASGDELASQRDRIPQNKIDTSSVTRRHNQPLYSSKASTVADTRTGTVPARDENDKALAQASPVSDPVDNNPVRSGDPANKLATLAPPVAQRPAVAPETSRVAADNDPDKAQSRNTSFATQALMASENNDAEDGYSDEEPRAKKNRLRGLFRKVTRVLDKKADRDDDDKRSVQIGSFQFALK